MTQKHALDETILDSYTLLPPEIDFIGRKRQDHNRLAQAIFLKYFQEHSLFPTHPNDLPPNAIDWVADQMQISPELLTLFDWQGRTAKRYRSQIRDWLGFRSSTLADQCFEAKETKWRQKTQAAYTQHGQKRTKVVTIQ